MKKDNIRDRILVFLKTLPPVVSVKAYGSSIAYQAGYSENEKKQVDLIVIVDDIKKFYMENLQLQKKYPVDLRRMPASHVFTEKKARWE